jgi:tetratricopeptide (TPR) repeat protein
MSGRILLNYTSYALLYKALIKRDFGLIEDAEKCTSEAIKLSPGFTEAMYQNAQYNALLNRPEKAIPLLKKAIWNTVGDMYNRRSSLCDMFLYKCYTTAIPMERD